MLISCHDLSCYMMWCAALYVLVLSCFVYRYALMQSCWFENPLMRPSFEDITKQIKYLLRKNQVCAACLLVTVTVSALSFNHSRMFFFLPFSVSLYLKKILLVNCPFARSGQMVRYRWRWDANKALRLSNLCFGSPSALFTSQQNLFRTMRPNRPKGLFLSFSM